MDDMLEDVIRFISRQNRILKDNSKMKKSDEMEFDDISLKIKNKIHELKENKIGINSSKGGGSYYVGTSTAAMDDISFTCEFCDQHFNGINLLNAHIKTHNKNILYQCTICNENFKNLEEMQSHLETHSSSTKGSQAHGFKCQKCDTLFDMKYELHIHNVMKHLNRVDRRGINLYKLSKDGRHICPHPNCGKLFARPYETTRHVLTHKERGKRTYYSNAFGISCGLPRSKTSVKPSLKDHPYPCPICPKAFKTSSNCVEHLKVCHYKTKQHLCPYEDCKKGFALLQQVKKHVKKAHNPDGIFKCDHCYMVFQEEQPLQRHLKEHHSEYYNSFSCKRCPSKFISQNTLNKHLADQHQIY